MSSSRANGGGREAEVRDRIFNSALRLFSQKGFAATSLREVAEEAQTTKPMIYYYFGSKEGLYSGIVRQILGEMAETIRRGLPAEAEPTEQVRAFCARYLEYFLANEEVIALVLREVFGLGGGAMETFGDTLAQQVRHPLDQVLQRGMDTGIFRKDDVRYCASALTGILNMFILVHVFGGAVIHADQALAQVNYYIAGLATQR